jgi:peptidyl-prolyl cis-trans isomerase SurA
MHNNLMKYIILTISLLVQITLYAQPKIVDKVVAKVGANAVLLSDIQSQVLQAIQENMEHNNELECSILEELLYQNLLLNQADRKSTRLNSSHEGSVG